MTSAAGASSAIDRAQGRLAWMFLCPALVILSLVGIYPLLNTLYMSFTDSEAGQVSSTLVGFRNYSAIVRDGDFLKSILNTLVFGISSVTLELIIGMVAALVINVPFRGRAILRAAVLIPWAIPTVVSARMWEWMLNDSFGVINDIAVRKLHVIAEPIAWTGTNSFAMASVIAVDVWKTFPFFALMLLAGLQGIPAELYESARVDGATGWQQFRRITLPLLKPAITVAVVFRSLDALRVFDVVWVLTRGKFGTESVGVYAYRQLFEYINAGTGSAVCIALFLMVFLFVIVYTTLMREPERS
ncbi:sugar ABC transporter permease [Candidatus Sumerlaeota bacterium]|nr:sugar ABC transporter permease [Candidatus Sumerlaeota bacterium]